MNGRTERTRAWTPLVVVATEQQMWAAVRFVCGTNEVNRDTKSYATDDDLGPADLHRKDCYGDEGRSGFVWRGRMRWEKGRQLEGATRKYG